MAKHGKTYRASAETFDKTQLNEVPEAMKIVLDGGGFVPRGIMEILPEALILSRGSSAMRNQEYASTMPQPPLSSCVLSAFPQDM